MFCTQCGKQGDGKFCQACGAPLPVSPTAAPTTSTAPDPPSPAWTAPTADAAPPVTQIPREQAPAPYSAPKPADGTAPDASEATGTPPSAGPPVYLRPDADDATPTATTATSPSANPHVANLANEASPPDTYGSTPLAQATQGDSATVDSPPLVLEKTPRNTPSKKKIGIIVAACVLVAGLALGAYFLFIAPKNNSVANGPAASASATAAATTGTASAPIASTTPAVTEYTSAQYVTLGNFATTPFALVNDINANLNFAVTQTGLSGPTLNEATTVGRMTEYSAGDADTLRLDCTSSGEAQQLTATFVANNVARQTEYFRCVFTALNAEADAQQQSDAVYAALQSGLQPDSSTVGYTQSSSVALYGVQYSLFVSDAQTCFVCTPATAYASTLLPATPVAPAGAQTSSTQPLPSSTIAQSTEGSWAAGSYLVGTDLPAGEYFLLGSGYMSVTTDQTGSPESILTHDNIATFKYITVIDGQYLTAESATLYAATDAPAVEQLFDVTTAYPQGMYKVGRDIAAGTYNVTPDAGATAYIEVASNSTGTLESVLSNNNISAPQSVTVSDGQYFTVTGGTFVAGA